MLETSKDLLNIVIAFSVLWFTVFMCWFIYYIVMIIKRVADTTDQLARMAGNVNDFFGEAKTRLKNATSYAPIVIEGIKSLTEYLKDKQTVPVKRKPKKTKKLNQTKFVFSSLKILLTNIIIIGLCPIFYSNIYVFCSPTYT